MVSNPNWGCSHLTNDFWSSYKIVFIIKVKIIMLIIWLYMSPPHYVLYWIMIIIILWVCNPISFKHVIYIHFSSFNKSHKGLYSFTCRGSYSFRWKGPYSFTLAHQTCKLKLELKLTCGQALTCTMTKVERQWMTSFWRISKYLLNTEST